MPTTAEAMAVNPVNASTTAYSFDSEATPEQKKQALLSLAPNGLKTSKRHKAEEIIGDLHAAPTLSMPPPNASDVATQELNTPAKHKIFSGSHEPKIGCMLYLSPKFSC